MVIAQLVKVGTKAEFEDLEAGKLVEAGGRSIAIFNLGGSLEAIENTCPPRGGSLAEGMLAGEEVTYPQGMIPPLLGQLNGLRVIDIFRAHG